MAMNKKELIYLDEAIARIQDEGVYGEGYSDSERINNVCDILEGCNIVDTVEMVHGHWHDFENDPMWQQCSACNYIIQYSYSKDCNYCPNCGAKMMEVSNE